MANSKETVNANPLHHLQMPFGAGVIVSNNTPIIHNTSGRIELVKSARSRNLSAGDHS